MWIVIDSPTPLISKPLGSQRDSSTPSDLDWTDLGSIVSLKKAFLSSLPPSPGHRCSLVLEKWERVSSALESQGAGQPVRPKQPLPWSPSRWASPPPALTPASGPQSPDMCEEMAEEAGADTGSDDVHSPTAPGAGRGVSGFQGFPCENQWSDFADGFRARTCLCCKTWSGRTESCSASLQVPWQHNHLCLVKKSGFLNFL